MTDSQNNNPPTMLWTFIAIALMIFGFIILAEGLYHLIMHHPFHTALARIHPDIIWGIIMIIFGLLLYLFNRHHRKSLK